MEKNARCAAGFGSLTTPFDFDDLPYLSVPLPEDLAALKGAGHFDALRRAIDTRLARPWLEEGMRRRLRLELFILERLEEDYTLTRPQLQAALEDLLRDFDPAELDGYEADGLLDWIFIEGEQRFLNSAVDNLFVVDPALPGRRRTWPDATRAMKEEEEKDGMRRTMRQCGRLAMRYRIRCELQLKPEAVREGKLLRVQLPLPLEAAQSSNVQLLQTSHTPVVVAPADHAQRTVVLEAPARPGEVFWAEYQYDCENPYLPAWELAELPCEQRPAGSAPALTEEEQRRYTAQQAPHIAFTPYLQGLAQRIVGDLTDPLAKARAIYDWITRNIRYSFARSYFAIPNLPEFTARNQKGDCGMETLLFITLCRICGVPARWQAGRSMTPWSGGTSCHDWAQFYAAPYGWLWVDCSYGVGAWRAGDDEKRRFFFGNTIPARIVLAGEFQHRLYVPMHWMRFDPYDNQEGEAEYADGGISYRDLVCSTRILHSERLMRP